MAVADFYIRKIKIENLFNQERIREIDFSDGVNCIYGANGSGKTTIINLLVASLMFDVKRLLKTRFSNFIVYTAKTGQKRASKFFAVEKNESNKITYLFDDETIEFIDLPGVDNAFIKSKIRTKIEARLSITFVPLNRTQETDYADIRDREFMYHNFVRGNVGDGDDLEIMLDPIRRMLTSLERKFKDNFALKQKLIRNELESLKEKVLEKLFIDDTLFNNVNKHSLSLKKAETQDYITAKQKFDEIGLRLPPDKLEKHFEIMSKVTAELDKKQKIYLTNNELKSSDASNQKLDESIREYSSALRTYRSLLPFHSRLMSIISDVEKSTDYRLSEMSMFKNFQDSINDFLVNKKFDFNEIGGFNFKCANSTVNIEDLSSGEKHLLGLLGRVALAPSNSAIFIADEPELSLHLSWQRKLLPSIEHLSPNMQIIVATHAPAIIPSGVNKIDLDEIGD